MGRPAKTPLLRGSRNGLHRALTQHEKLLEDVQHIGQLTLSTLDFDEVLDRLSRHVVGVGIFRSLAISLPDYGKNIVSTVRATVHRPEGPWVQRESDDVGISYSLDSDDILAETVRTGELQMAIGPDKRLNTRKPSKAFEGNIAYFIPVKKEETVVAVLATGSSTEEKDVTLQKIELVRPLFDQIAIAVEHARLYHDAQEEINRRKKTEEKLKKREEQLFQAQKLESVGRLAGGVAHDFNNLLQVIKGYAELAMDNVEPDCIARDDLREVLDAANQAATLVAQLLAFSRHQILELADLDLNCVIVDMTEIIRATMGSRIDVQMEPANETGLIRGDKSQIEQMLMNICINSREAMPDGGSIKIRTNRLFAGDTFCKNHEWAMPGYYRNYLSPGR